jgi:hypothetical protein
MNIDIRKSENDDVKGIAHGMGKTDVTYKDFLLNGHPRIA